MTNEERIHELVDAGEFEIDSHGRIWRVAERRGKSETATPIARKRAERVVGKGYLGVRARFRNGVRIEALAHRLVSFHFDGPIPADREINHDNGIKSDNRPRNLKRTTRGGNNLHATRTLGERVREKHHGAKLTTRKVRKIRSRAAAGESKSALAREYGVAPSTVWNVVARNTWQTVN